MQHSLKINVNNVGSTGGPPIVTSSMRNGTLCAMRWSIGSRFYRKLCLLLNIAFRISLNSDGIGEIWRYAECANKRNTKPNSYPLLAAMPRPLSFGMCLCHGNEPVLLETQKLQRCRLCDITRWVLSNTYELHISAMCLRASLVSSWRMGLTISKRSNYAPNTEFPVSTYSCDVPVGHR
jgi:hypothetical protein